MVGVLGSLPAVDAGPSESEGESQAKAQAEAEAEATGGGEGGGEGQAFEGCGAPIATPEGLCRSAACPVRGQLEVVPNAIPEGRGLNR